MRVYTRPMARVNSVAILGFPLSLEDAKSSSALRSSMGTNVMEFGVTNLEVRLLPLSLTL